MKSPGYAQAITWISEILALIVRYFDQCGITSSNLADHHSQVRNFVRSSELIDDVLPIDPALNDANAFDKQRSDEWDADLEALNSTMNRTWSQIKITFYVYKTYLFKCNLFWECNLIQFYF